MLQVRILQKWRKEGFMPWFSNKKAWRGGFKIDACMTTKQKINLSWPYLQQAEGFPGGGVIANILVGENQGRTCITKLSSVSWKACAAKVRKSNDLKNWTYKTLASGKLLFIKANKYAAVLLTSSWLAKRKPYWCCFSPLLTAKFNWKI